MTDSGGKATVTIEAGMDRSFRRGVLGYYRILAIDPSTGLKRGEWGSVPINGPTESLFLPLAGRAIEEVPILLADEALVDAVRALLVDAPEGMLRTSDVAHLA